MDSLGFIDAFISGSIISKAVFILLICLSVYSWSLIIQKIILFKKLKSQLARFTYLVNEGTLEDTQEYINTYKNAYSSLLAVLLEKYAYGEHPENSNGYIENTCETKLYPVVQKLEYNTSLIATIANTAPFIGLCGTVFGVIHAFNRIGLTKSASLAVIAPGIAESLYATAMGLLVAVPASIAYNIIMSKINYVSDQHDLLIDKLILKLHIRG